MENRISRNLAAAIETMRNACDDAERRSKDGSERGIKHVMHALSWGFANASSSIETAMAAAEDEREIKASKLSEVEKKAMAGEKNTYRYRQGDEFPLDEIYAIQGLGGGDWWEKIPDGARDLDMSDVCRCTRDIKITVAVY